MFREVADIQTADMLKLPVPKVNYHNIKTKPSEIQTEMVASLAKRAEKVRARLVEPNIDNMLKITNDGRKLALDQRMIDPMLPDDPESKVNACVDNVYRIWEEHADTKATQLVFCDLSTPKNDGTFNVYDDMREKLIALGIPAEQIRFIHEATTDAQKKELFGKVRSGEVRVLFGSTPKMGAGTNVQDRLIAIHNLDCPWRPSDLEQRQGRIERQGNMFPEVEVYRYVTEQTFDAYLYQLVESKQKFISQIMTSKSPIRSAEDVDEVALSFAEVKMLATGDARFKEKMDLDIQVSKLRVLKQSYLSEHYDLEDRVLKYYPQTIKEYEEPKPTQNLMLKARNEPLKKYDVTLTAHYQKTVSVYAESHERAKEKTKIILFDTDLINFTDDDFVCGEADITEQSEDGLDVAGENTLQENGDCSDCPYFCPVCGECMYEDDCEE